MLPVDPETKNYSSKRRRAGGYISCALLHGIGRDHTCTGITFRRAHRHTGLQIAGYVEMPGTLFRQDTCIFTRQYGVEIETLSAIGVSAMMHGYMPFDKNGRILVPFRTWRNTNTGVAAAEASKGMNMEPQVHQTALSYVMSSSLSPGQQATFLKHLQCPELSHP